MKLYGSLSRLVAVLFRKDSQDITLRPNQATTYSAARDVQLPLGDAAHVLVSTDSVDTLTNKSIDAATNTISNISNSEIKSGAAIDAAKIADGSVSSTEFQYINSLSSNAQTQLDGKQPLDSDLTALAGLAATGLIARTGSGTVSARTLTAGTGISISNGDGVSGNPTISATATTASFKANWVTGDGTSKSITHSLGSLDVIVQVYDKANGQTIEVDVSQRTDTNTLDLTASEAPNASGWRVMILAV